MAAILQPSLSIFSNPTLKNKTSMINKKKQNSKKLKVSSSTITPLLSNQAPQPQTKHQLLDQVLADLQLSLSQGVPLDLSLLSSLLETCHRLRSPHHAAVIHTLIPPYILRRSADLSSKLLRLYAELGLLDCAQQLFDEMPQRARYLSAFPSNSLIAGYAEAGRHEEAMAVYLQMEEDGVVPDAHTFPRVLKACGGLGDIRIGEAVHRDVVRLGFGADPFVLNALVAMYAKCGDIVRARKIFSKLRCRDSVSWNTMVTGYLLHGLFHEAIRVLRVMMAKEKIRPDSVALSALLAHTNSLSMGVEMHGWIVRNEEGDSLSIMNSLISMYGRFGMVREARVLFEEMQERDVVSWNAMIKCYSGNHRALLLFRQMECDIEVLPDCVTFVSLLSTCASLGLVKEGRQLLAKMERKYGIKASVEHYGCMVNLLGRAGMVEEAYLIAKDREVSVTSWGALLYACSVHGNVEIGEIAAKMLFDLEPDNRENFELLKKIYRDKGRLEEEEVVTKMIIARGLNHD